MMLYPKYGITSVALHPSLNEKENNNQQKNALNQYQTATLSSDGLLMQEANSSALDAFSAVPTHRLFAFPVVPTHDPHSFLQRKTEVSLES